MRKAAIVIIFSILCGCGFRGGEMSIVRHPSHITATSNKIVDILAEKLHIPHNTNARIKLQNYSPFVQDCRDETQYFKLSMELITLQEKTKRELYKKFYFSYPRVRDSAFKESMLNILCPVGQAHQAGEVFFNKFDDKPNIINMDELIKTMQNTIDNNSKNPQDNSRVFAKVTKGAILSVIAGNVVAKLLK